MVRAFPELAVSGDHPPSDHSAEQPTKLTRLAPPHLNVRKIA